MQKEIIFKEITDKIEVLQKDFNPKVSFAENVENVDIDLNKLEKLFKNWANISAEDFFKYIKNSSLKSKVQHQQKTLFDVISEKDIADKKQVFADFIKIIPIAFEDLQNTEKNLQINYSFATSIFGFLLLASTEKGICFLNFYEDKENALNTLKQEFPKAIFQEKSDLFQENALVFFEKDQKKHKKLTLHIKGTEFQLKVWKELLKIPFGELSTYGEIAKKINNPKASRAVGTAIGSNSIAFLIPCHRVIQTSGKFGGYKWNSIRKTAIIGWEGLQKSS